MYGGQIDGRAGSSVREGNQRKEKLFMTSTKQVDHDFRWKRVLGVSAAILLAGASAASYLHSGAVSQKNVLKGSLDKPAIQQSQAKVNESVGKLPLAFEPNLGQTDAQVKYVARAKGYTAFLTESETVLSIKGSAKGSARGVLRMKMPNARSATRLETSDPQVARSNYLKGDRSKWITDVANYGRVTAKEVYPGIDVAYHGSERTLEYDFVVKPGADSNQIRVAYEGSSRFTLDAAGNLDLETAAGRTLAQKPIAYQTIHGVRKPVKSEYVLMANNQVGFKLGAYDRSQTLIIDPVVQVLAMFGGTGNDEGYAIFSNSTGVCLPGRPTSAAFPPSPNPLSEPVATFGGPSGQPVPSVAQTLHAAPGSDYDAYVTKLDATGTTLIYSTFLGGPGDDSGEGIAADSTGVAYVAGYASQPMGPAAVAPYSGVYAAFVAKLSLNGQALLALTYYGGAGTTEAFSLALDSASNVVIGGLTNNLSTQNTTVGTNVGFQKTFNGGTTDGFVAKFDAGLNLVAGTFLGGGGYDQVNSVAVDTAGAIYAAGVTSSGNTAVGASAAFPVSGAIAVGTINSTANQQTAFVAKLNSSLSSRSYASIFGVGGEPANGIAVDSNNIAYVVGATRNFNFYPASNPTLVCNGFACVTPMPNGSLPISAGNNLGTAQTGNCVAFSTQGGPTGCLAAGTPIPGLVPPPGSTVLLNPFNPAVTQAYLLEFSSGGSLNTVTLGAVAPADPAAGSTPCLNLTKNGGAFGTGLTCSTFFASWNAVAVDADQQAYITGQAPIGAPTNYSAPIIRVNRAVGALPALVIPGSVQSTVTITNGVAGGNQIGYGISVNNATRQAFFDGNTQVANVAGLVANIPLAQAPPPGAGLLANIVQGLRLFNWSPTAGGSPFGQTPLPFVTPTSFAPSPNNNNYGTLGNDGLIDVLYGAVQYNDVVSVNQAGTLTVNLAPIGLFAPVGSAGPTGTVALFTPSGTASACNPILGTLVYTRPVNTTLTSGGVFVTQPSPIPPFTVVANPGTNTLTVQYSSSATLGTFNAIQTLTCAGAENSIALTVTGAVNGSLAAAPQDTLTPLSSTFGSGIISPLFNPLGGGRQTVQNQPNMTVPVTVTLPSANDFCSTTGGNSATQPGVGGLVLGGVALTGCPYTVSIPASSKSANFPTGCTLLSTNTQTSIGGVGITRGLAHPLSVGPTTTNGGVFNAVIDANCASTLPLGDYTASIVATSAAGIATAPVPFKLSIVSGGVISQTPLLLAFVSNTSASQQTSFSVNTQAASLTYLINYVPSNPPLNPLPIANVQLVAGGSGTVLGGGTNSVIVQITPGGLANGVYTGLFQVVTPGTNPVQSVVVSTIGITVFVGTGIGVQSPATASNAVNVSVPSGFPFGNLFQPSNIIITALSNPSSVPLTVGLPTLTTVPASMPNGTSVCVIPTASQAAPPPSLTQPVCAIQIAPVSGDSCSTFAPGVLPGQQNSQNCKYRVTVDTTLLTPGPYNSVLTFTSGSSTVNVPINVTVTPTPGIAVNQNLNLIGVIGAQNTFTPVTALNFSGVAGVDQTTCQTVSINPTGGQVNNVTATSIVNWLGFANFPGAIQNFGTGFQQIANFGTLVGGGFSFSVCVNAVGQPTRPATLTSNVVIGGNGTGPVILPVTFTLSGGAGNPANFQQLAVLQNQASGLTQFALDRNGDFNFLSPPDNFRQFGLNLDRPVAGDWFGTGVISLGVFRCPANDRPAGGECGWYIDANNNGNADSIAAGDPVWHFGLADSATTHDEPIVGDWTGDGISKIGVMRCPLVGQPGVCTWYLDVGNKHASDSTVRTIQFGLPGDKPVANNWNGGGNVDQIGVFRCPLGGTPLAPIAGTCSWLVDSNGTAATTQLPGTTYPTFGLTGDIPIVGNWFGTGRKRIGVFRGGPTGVQLNLSGPNTVGVTAVDFIGNFGLPGDRPVVGFWTLP